MRPNFSSAKRLVKKSITGLKVLAPRTNGSVLIPFFARRGLGVIHESCASALILSPVSSLIVTP